MALPNITLAQFNRIASGTYNAGLVDFMTDEQGNLTGELTKVNNHVVRTVPAATLSCRHCGSGFIGFDESCIMRKARGAR